MAATLPIAGKVVVITGGTGGIGKATAIGLATIGARVGITGRDLARAEQAAAHIRATSGNPAVDAFTERTDLGLGGHVGSASRSWRFSSRQSLS